MGMVWKFELGKVICTFFSLWIHLKSSNRNYEMNYAITCRRINYGTWNIRLSGERDTWPSHVQAEGCQIRALGISNPMPYSGDTACADNSREGAGRSASNSAFVSEKMCLCQRVQYTIGCIELGRHNCDSEASGERE